MAAYTAQRCIGLHGASRHTQPRLVRVGCSSRRPAMVVRAVLDKANQGTTTTAGSRVTVLSLMSSCVSIDVSQPQVPKHMLSVLPAAMACLFDIYTSEMSAITAAYSQGAWAMLRGAV